jgi:hypothetical protein
MLEALTIAGLVISVLAGVPALVRQYVALIRYLRRRPWRVRRYKPKRRKHEPQRTGARRRR